MFELVESVTQSALIKVIGVGGGGGNAVQHMVDRGVEGIEFICANTDAQALSRNAARTALHIGGELTKGLGAGANPAIGRQAAVEDRDRIAESLSGADMLFITAGMGGGTGTGAAPIVAEVARELGILTVAVVTRPFAFEGRKRMKIAEEGIEELRHAVDSLIIIPNEKLMQVLGKNCSLVNAFSAANDVLKGAVQGIADLITRPGMINVDFADVKTVMSEMGMAMMGSAKAKGDNRAEEAAEAAIRSPLLEDIDLRGASGILVNIAAGEDLSLGEFSEVGSIVEQYADEDATIVVGTVIDPSLGEEIKVTVVATGLDRARGQGMSVVENKAPVNSTRKADGSLNLDNIELPTVLRRQREEALVEKPRQQEPRQEKSMEQAQRGDEYDSLDIPTFLRRQAD